MNYKAIIVDDEMKACQVLQFWLDQTHAFKIVASFTDPVEAFESLENTKPEIVFLDIDMPILNGIQFTEKTLRRFPEIRIVMTTAHEKYAIQALNAGVFGYLLKPYNYQEICDLVGRLLKDPIPHSINSLMSFSTKDKEYFFHTEDILYLKAVGNYSEIHTAQRESILFSKTLKYFKDFLPEGYFIRLSRGLIINNLFLHCIDKKKHLAILKYPSGEMITLKIKDLPKENVKEK